MSEKEVIAKAPITRVRRNPVGQRNILTVAGKEPGYDYRFVNDEGDRVQEFLDNGWEIVEKKTVRIGDKRVGQAAPEGSAATASVGQGKTAFVLRIREEWKKEDDVAKQALVDASEQAMKEKALDGTYGKLEIGRG